MLENKDKVKLIPFLLFNTLKLLFHTINIYFIYNFITITKLNLIDKLSLKIVLLCCR